MEILFTLKDTPVLKMKQLFILYYLFLAIYLHEIYITSAFNTKNLLYIGVTFAAWYWILKYL